MKDYDIDDYFTDIDDYPENLDSEYEPDLDERYWDDEYYCPVCGSRKEKYIERGECRGTPYSIELWECPNGCC